MDNMRTIRVTGKGKIRIRPDLTRITMTLEGTYKDYGETMKHSSEDTEALKAMLAEYGFDKTEIKTISFDVDTEFESYRENEDYKERFVGYKYTHVLKLEFDSDNERLGKIVFAIVRSEVHPEFRISYTVKDKDAAKNEVLAKAVKDAKKNAIVLSEAAGVTLKDIQSIDYSWGEIDFEVRPMKNFIDNCANRWTLTEGFFDTDIEPEDIELSDTVTVVWEIG